jgi:hypothetical protein
VDDSDYKWGDDGEPGVACVDDDLDGTTDEEDESPALRPTTVNNGYGHAGPNAYQAGQDGVPGDPGVDDDGNGTTDDYGEICFPGTDDGDDLQGRKWFALLRGDLTASSFAYLSIEVAAGSERLFSILSWTGASGVPIALANNLNNPFWEAHEVYNWVFCHSGSCYGAMLWVDDSISNPAEVLGPLVNTLHLDEEDSTAGLVAYSGVPLSTVGLMTRQSHFRGSTNFSNKYWVVSGNPMQYPYFPSLNEDLDGDRDVDGNDFLTFSLCYNGALRPPQSGCANLDADLDGDGDVDGFDFTTWSLCHNGSLKRPQAGCMAPNLTPCP